MKIAASADPREGAHDRVVRQFSGQVWLTVAEAATHACVSTDTIYTAVERGELRHTRISGRRSIRIKADWIDQWLERHAYGAESELSVSA